MDNKEIRQLIERLEHKESVFVSKDCHEAARTLSLLLDVKVAADDDKLAATEGLLLALIAVEDA